MISYVFVPLFSAWAAFVIKIAISGPPFDLLSTAAFFTVFGPLMIGPLLAVSPRSSAWLVSSTSEPVIFVFTLIAAATSAVLFAVGLVTSVVVFLLVGPLWQYLVFRGGIRRFRRKYQRLPVEPRAIAVLNIFVVPKGTPLADRVYLDVTWLLSWTPFFVALFAVT